MPASASCWSRPTRTSTTPLRSKVYRSKTPSSTRERSFPGEIGENWCRRKSVPVLFSRGGNQGAEISVGGNQCQFFFLDRRKLVSVLLRLLADLHQCTDGPSSA